ncbi:MAG: class I SAM-dependent rRNA methyltransferase [Planctomycetota bacterium]
MTSVEVRLTAKATRLARKGHPWFFADDLEAASTGGADLVRVLAADGRPLGLGLFSPESRLRLRLCGGGPIDAAADVAPADFFAARLVAAIARRAALRGPGRGARLVHGEADGLPGLVVDEYDNALVLQITSAAVETYVDAIVPALVEQTGAVAVIARHDLAVRAREGLPQEVRLLHGRRLEVATIEEHGVRHEVSLLDGHKTGFYLDQRPARGRVKALASGRRVLDAFAYQGAFGLAALAGAAADVTLVDQSAPALARAATAAGANGFTAPLVTRTENVFDALRALRAAGGQFDLVIVDPPPFAKSRREIRGAVRGYRDLNRHALRLLAPGGLLATFTCSHHVARPAFEDLLRQAAAELPFRVVLRERLMAGEDHPIWLSLPESEYLKGCLLERVD